MLLTQRRMWQYIEGFYFESKDLKQRIWCVLRLC